MKKILLLTLSLLMFVASVATVNPITAQAAGAITSPDTTLAEVINAYRVAHGQQPLKITYHLTYIAAYRVQLTMFSDIDLGKVQIDTRLMPPNYTWQEIYFGGNNAVALAMNNPQTVLDHLINERDLADSILAPEFCHIGATLLCNGYRCGYVVILACPN